MSTFSMQRCRVVFSVAVALMAVRGVAAECEGLQTYSIDFDMKWTAEADKDFPEGAAYGSVFAIARSSELPLFGMNQTLTSSITSLADANDLRELEQDAKEYVENGTASAFFVDTEVNHEAVSTVSFKLTLNGTRSTTIVTAIAKLIPSPAWFAGGLQLELCDQDTNEFVESAELIIQGFDSGLSPGGENYSTLINQEAIQGNLTQTPFIVDYGVLRAKKDGVTSPDGGSDSEGSFNARGLIVGIVVVGLLIAAAFLAWQVYRRMHKPAPVPLSGIEEQDGGVNW